MISFFRSVLPAIAAIILAPVTTMAQSMPETSGEEVAMAFFKAADTNPDFEKWAKGTDQYHVVAPALADEYIAQEKQRLMRAWQAFDLDSDILNVRSTITVHLKHGTDDKGEEVYAMQMVFGKDDAPYFPFEFQDYKFAVIPQKIEPLLKQPLNKSQFELMYADFGEKLSGTVSLYLQMKAAKSYIQQPYEIDGIEQWVLLADPVTLSLKSYKTGADLWTHGASWYVSPAKQEVRDLYKSPELDAPFPQSP